MTGRLFRDKSQNRMHRGSGAPSDFLMSSEWNLGPAEYQLHTAHCTRPTLTPTTATTTRTTLATTATTQLHYIAQEIDGQTDRQTKGETERNREKVTERVVQRERERLTASTTFRSISVFALPSMHHNNSPILQFPIFETSATVQLVHIQQQNYGMLSCHCIV